MSWLTPDLILVPVDFSAASLAAVDQAVQFAGAADKVHVVHVLHELPTASPGVAWGTVTDATRVGHVTTALNEQLADHPGLHFHTPVGDPGTVIASLAQQLKVDLIIMPSHGRTGLSRLLLGSVADRVVRLSTLPVLVLNRGQ